MSQLDSVVLITTKKYIFLFSIHKCHKSAFKFYVFNISRVNYESDERRGRHYCSVVMTSVRYVNKCILCDIDNFNFLGNFKMSY